MILVFGSINMDLVASVAAIPRPGETVLSPGYRTLFGGKGANQAVAAARMGGRVAMIGRVGGDAFGQACRANLAANGVDTGAIVTATEPTGCAFITVDAAGENAITVASGANGAVEASDLPDREIGPGTLAVMQMEVPPKASLAAARKVKAAGGRVLWNLAPAPAGLSEAALRDILATTDIFVVNEIEALMAARALGGATDIEAAGQLVARRGGMVCVVTAGASGAFACLPDGTVRHTPAPPVTPVDTTGAGDTFVGVLASELGSPADLGSRADLDAALRRACAAASMACLATGAQDGMPDRQQLDAWLSR
ncbi:ribokinase [Ancylobacter dichloromethanicus]|uniref:Ribokinase n=1 Tax=Ancylobacter dichloromethanicus TaxID=518825 RepID=A0A9W6JFJ3_9HYPH|nr:ribokinase [Ancylobacter dichloromethanicus]MBS7553101.1 ribokinase [Ancylobacter dichloromethanicus]GLK74618.1 ribokinase [Ancylobacter dichloromethanicus]